VDVRYPVAVPAKLTRIGLISDTHNLLRPTAKLALAGVERIIHAGDTCSARVLEELRKIAPVVAVRGNNDRGAWASAIPMTQTITIEAVSIHIIHDLDELEHDSQGAGFHVVVSGHSHRPRVERREGILFVNPGSAGPRRFTLPISVGILEIAGGIVDAKLYTLNQQ